MISVLILTYNEEVNLERCLQTVTWSDDIVVLDSFSKDRTIEIAQNYGARIIQRVFDNEKTQREVALKIQFKYPWVYNPDADEITTPELRDEMLSIVADMKRLEVAYRVRFKNMFMGKWVKYSSLYPTWVMRLFRPAKIRFERNINLTYVTDGPVGTLQSHFLHYSFNKGFEAWFEKHNRYSTAEAIETLKDLALAKMDGRGIFTFYDVVRRRHALKQLSFRLPFRPSLRFFYMYFLRGGFLDGWAGFIYCRLLSIYEYMIVLKVKEIQRRERGLPI